ncbi:MAG: hypothetical protein IJV92_08000 [Phascolarctobacterium sp.]|nr:hypothetical protein [Phascolarctobacterium sp.]
MKKTMLVLSILAAFALTGCGGEQKSAPASKTPEAKPAVKVEEQQQENQERKYKFKRNVKLGDGLTGQPLHQFKTNNQ